jgi:hypothetical protein
MTDAPGVLIASLIGRIGVSFTVLVRERRRFMRKLLVAGVSCFALGLSGAAFAAGGGSGSTGGGSGNSGGAQSGTTGTDTSGGVSGNTGGNTAGGKAAGAGNNQQSDTTSQREACPPGALDTSNCIKKGQ